ncbi:MAG TPA: 5-carboxymethyl-2-hydroxymuconate isomerase [Polaromonas sp.]|uniref:5-carboxymethyl-2-hydroxymuconate isomerase n=1 Tax=Polaromonas sp. TaxID=1869339 RepID=UPI002D524115|nr:5-carboxymethyl-2-hydroxymuconate isomerase [Polaromonas sp.]HYW57017.1 5-carboxymethyl-2-hydroxymuconate isomerase [Polaromonas sp.]
MPHLKIEYTANLDPQADMGGLCKALAGVVTGLKDDQGQPVFPLHGTRVLAYPAPHHAVADGQPDRAFVYLHLRIKAGRSDAIKKIAGDALLERAKAHFEPLFKTTPIGITVQIEEGVEHYNAMHNNLQTFLAK